MIEILALNATSDIIFLIILALLAKKTAINVHLVVCVRYVILGIIFHQYLGYALNALRIALHAQKIKSVLPARTEHSSTKVTVFLALQTALPVVISDNALNAKPIFSYGIRVAMHVRENVQYVLVKLNVMSATQELIN